MKIPLLSKLICLIRRRRDWNYPTFLRKDSEKVCRTCGLAQKIGDFN